MPARATRERIKAIVLDHADVRPGHPAGDRNDGRIEGIKYTAPVVVGR
jgi:hypothetical protein